MAFLIQLRIFAIQVRALTSKNLLLFRRKWISTLIHVFLLPLLVVNLLGQIPNMTPQRQYGVGTPAAIPSLRSTITHGKEFVVIANSTMGPDVHQAVKQLLEPLADVPVLRFNNLAETTNHCVANLRGISKCHAIVDFKDSPLTEGGRGNWTYTISADPTRNGWFIGNPYSHDNYIEGFWLPVQLAVENAITNNTDPVHAMSYTSTLKEEADRRARESQSYMIMGIFSFIWFLAFLPIIFHAVNFITTDRELGMSQLTDAMGGGAAARVTANVLSLNALYMPSFIIQGSLYWYYLFNQSNAAILIFWFIFFGIALTNSTIFGSAFFHHRRVSAIVVSCCQLALAGGAAAVTSEPYPTASIVAMSFLFPASNWICTLVRMARFQNISRPLDVTTSEVPQLQYPDKKYEFNTQIIVFWVFLFIHMVAYPMLAILVERLLHGISFTRRQLAPPGTTQTSSAAVETTDLKKVYKPSILRTIFCCGRTKPEVKAVDGLSLVAHRNQILCLLGVNGSGKTTTLDLIGGLQGSTAGSVKINCPATELGICPQRNVLHGELTVWEHVRFWSKVKGGKEKDEDLVELINACDLGHKMHSRASSLSGGQKRKLCLANMFVGDSKVCLMDEVTTGLDPVSRRTIWNIILAERSKRSMLFTTHFLDEGEVLSDHIVLLSTGQLKCQGSGAEMKSLYGGGYWVHVPHVQGQPFPIVSSKPRLHQDRILYNVATTQEAAKLIRELEAAGCSGVELQGPTIEKVFLNLTNEVDVARQRDFDAGSPPATADGSTSPVLLEREQLASGRVISTWKQILVLMRKRFAILPRYWIAPLLALGLPAGLPAALKDLLPRDYVRPVCDVVVQSRIWPAAAVHFQGDSWYGVNSRGPSYKFGIGPPSYNETIWNVLGTFPVGRTGYRPFNVSYNMPAFRFQDSLGALQNFIGSDVAAMDNGALWLGNADGPPTLAFNEWMGSSNTMGLLNLLSSVRSGVKIEAQTSTIASLNTGGNSGSASIMYVVLVVLIFSFFPAFFALYPSFERGNAIRALQYSNGVRVFPLWMAHLLFDSITVLIIAVAVTGIVQAQIGQFFLAAGFLFPIILFYGMAALIIAYLMSRLCRTQLASFMATFGVFMLLYVGTILTNILPQSYLDVEDLQAALDGINLGLGLIIPTMNLWRAFAVGLNLNKVLCRSEGLVTDPGSFYAYGAPILFLIIQVIVLTLFLVWLESGRSFSALRAVAGPLLSRKRTKARHEEDDVEMVNEEISKEAARVKESEDDLLRLTNVTKSFGSNTAVDNTTFGLGKSEILALLGPNGAGKTTIANMIMGELRPDSGHIYLRGIDVHKNLRQAQKSLGVCPQFDALDLMTARQHLEFYAHVKGIDDVKGNVETIMRLIGLTPHADKLASRLSGGNKRKLSLSIALIGNPDVLILDEPSSAMDAAAKRVMWKLLEQVAPGRSVLLTTHSMEEADALATRAAIFSKRLLAIGTTQTLRQRYSNMYQVELVLKTAPESSPEEMEAVERWVRTYFADVAFEGDSLGGQIKFMVPNAPAGEEPAPGQPGEAGTGPQTTRSTIGRVIEILEAHREAQGISEYSIGAPTLERVFLSVVKANNVEEEDHGAKKRWWKF